MSLNPIENPSYQKKETCRRSMFLDKLANQVDATIYEELSSKPLNLDEASIIHERILRANTKDYGTYDPAPALVKPPFKLIPN
ncbi:protein CASPARIAN STRIP INTEGRITY FACTOR 2-like isoform X2 [Hevea brasiliensis]|uniref:protein CASPARIAN STRIP INTEGRITY FACTOR 2-like isoform X2 n=1 Tax=Hevea brasiliensis TaxID=3981 RepID=UPI0025D54785|nr:protein CASPARIAN STRIP INTEGRITY FACTOR 2-like isoform X2 [Hevea brasiliensis]